MRRRNRKAKKFCGLEIWTFKHAFRNEMPGLIHWTSIFAFALIVWAQLSNWGRLFV